MAAVAPAVVAQRRRLGVKVLILTNAAGSVNVKERRLTVRARRGYIAS